MSKTPHCSHCRDTGIVEILDENGRGDFDFCSCKMGERKAQEEWARVDAEMDRQFMCGEMARFEDFDEPNPYHGTYSEM